MTSKIPQATAWPFPVSLKPVPVKVYPQRGITYSLRYILQTLRLRDSPSLLFPHEGKMIPIQESHCTDEVFLANADFADTNWTYQYETDEWIPVFYLARGEDLNGLVTVIPERDYYTGENVQGEWLAFPTHAPRKTDYELRVEQEPTEESFADALNAMDQGHAAMLEENAKLREQK